MIDDVLAELNDGIRKSLDALRRELAKVRTGRAHPSILDRVRVDYYGTPTPISQMANVGVPDASLLTVKPWEKSQVQAIDKAIRESGLGLNPQVDGDLIRIPIPPLTEERRKEMVKLTKKHGEEAKIAIRQHRRDAMDMLQDAIKEGEISEDDGERGKKKVEETVSDHVKQVDTIVAEREAQIMQV
ncbi:MAG TPA: ribosome recycling factor [Polyangiaceae bacterium]|nr:ribosome recycling factor [Polyangiaceae bacterium]